MVIAVLTTHTGNHSFHLTKIPGFDLSISFYLPSLEMENSWSPFSVQDLFMYTWILTKLYPQTFSGCTFHSLVAQMVKRLSTMRQTWVQSLGWENPLEKEMAILSRTIAWKIPWTEEPGRLQSMGSQRVGHD